MAIHIPALGNTPVEERIKQRVEKYLEQVTYKRGSDFGAYWAWDGSLMIRMRLMVASVDHPGDQIPIFNSVRLLLSLDMDEAKFQVNMRHAVEDLVRKTEWHETDEWLKFGGVHFNEPHPEVYPKGRETSGMGSQAEPPKEGPNDGKGFGL